MNNINQLSLEDNYKDTCITSSQDFLTNVLKKFCPISGDIEIIFSKVDTNTKKIKFVIREYADKKKGEQ